MTAISEIYFLFVRKGKTCAKRPLFPSHDLSCAVHGRKYNCTHSNVSGKMPQKKKQNVVIPFDSQCIIREVDHMR